MRLMNKFCIFYLLALILQVQDSYGITTAPPYGVTSNDKGVCNKVDCDYTIMTDNSVQNQINLDNCQNTIKICYTNAELSGGGLTSTPVSVQVCTECDDGYTFDDQYSEVDSNRASFCTVRFKTCIEDTSGGIELSCPSECPKEDNWTESPTNDLKELKCERPTVGSPYCISRCAEGKAYEVTRNGKPIPEESDGLYCLKCPDNGICSDGKLICEAGSYRSSALMIGYKGVYTCKICPDVKGVPAVSEAGSTRVTQCYVQKNIELEDDTGYFKFKTKDCFYTNPTSSIIPVPGV